MKRFLIMAAISISALANQASADEPLDIGSRLELFVDDYLVAELKGAAERKLQLPEPREVVLVTDKPWEGNTCAYYTIFQDGDLYRMYYRGSHADEKTQKALHPEVACYAESKDGIHWERPELGLFEFEGSKANNIIYTGSYAHNFTPFKDLNPQAAEDAKYKAMGVGKGLFAFKSPDGIHWKPLQDAAVITDGAFDSQNLAFWDPQIKAYREYHRGFVEGVRAIMTGTSQDFVNWTDPVYLNYPAAANEHLYTNTIRTYERAPHMLIGFPTRYQPKNSQVEPIFMSSRDGLTFQRWSDPVIPITAPEDRDGNRSNYMTWGLVRLPGDDKHYSVYATEAYYAGQDSRLRRFTYRVDGFVSLHAGKEGGELITKPLKFAGDDLVLNFVTADGGSVRVELQDLNGKPIDGFSLNDSQPLTGDNLEQKVSWKSDADLSKLAGKAIRLRFALSDADVYSLRFR